MNFSKNIFFYLFLFCLLSNLLFGQSVDVGESISVQCKNFNTADYSENAEFRCATDDGKGTMYFGTNYGVLQYRGEKKNGKKNWEYILLPEADIINAVYFDKSNNRLYVGAQHTFGYFQMSPYGEHRYVSLVELLPKSAAENGSEIWHVNKIGEEIVFHAREGLFVFKNEKIEVNIPKADPVFFHNAFETKSGLLANLLMDSWYLYNSGLKKIKSELPSDYKCYAVLPTNEENTYFFIYRDIGIYKARLENENITHVIKISDQIMDKVLTEQQVYCANVTADKKYLIIGTLNNGAYIFRNQNEFKFKTCLVSNIKTQTDVGSVYGLFKNTQGDIWVLGKTNLSLLANKFNFLYNEFKGVGATSLTFYKNDLYVSSTKGVFKINKLENQPQLVCGLRKKLLVVNDTLYSYSPTNELYNSLDKNAIGISFEELVVGMENFQNQCVLATSTKVYAGQRNIKEGIPAFVSKDYGDIVEACSVNDVLYLATNSQEFPIIGLNKKFKVVEKFKYDSLFTSVNHIKLFNCENKLLFTTTQQTFLINEGKIESYNKGTERVWLYKRVGEDVCKMNLDANNYNILSAKIDGAKEFINANLFSTNLEINDIEKTGNNLYAIADKNNLCLTELYSYSKPADINIFSFQSLKQIYNIDSTIIIPYDEHEEITIACAVNSYYASFPNTEYFYCLKGGDGKWKSQFTSEIVLHNISWGDYELEIKANYGNLITSQTKTIKFSIQKPWYITWWAILLWIFLIVLIIYIIVQISIYRLKQSKIKLEGIVQERTHEIVQQKNEIEKQKEVIVHKNIEITDSINYAKRIQTALLKDEDAIQSIVPNSFVLYIPKDIVSGDFYWFNKINDIIIVAIADCTGHGVPGAFMSMLGVAKLNELAAKSYTMPDVILKELNKLIVETLGQNKEHADSRDGMDISVIAIDKKQGKIYYAGANRSLIMVDHQDKTLHEIKATKIPVGGSQYGYERMYELHTLDIKTNTTLYLTTDGYADQFGGPNGKKFMTKNLAKLFLKNSGLPATEQYQFFKDAYLQWKGDYEQVDDVCIFGVNF